MNAISPPQAGAQSLGPLVEYLVDAFQRTVLSLDVLRQRGNNFLGHNARVAPHVLTYQADLVMDGRTFARPVNYALVRIKPPAGVVVDPRKRPFIVVDPRAGHGPGIGGMKQDSEIGVALQAGHPCYFVGFLPEPMPGQTVEDVCRAEARFVAKVAELHPDAPGKPCLIANCQAGWQVMMMAAVAPEVCGPIMLAGSPLSYWAGVRGRNPMRYLGGLLGGTWLTSMAGDMGNGIFDGANLVANFESLHPDNTYWKKPYDVFTKVDTEAERFLEFEKWWGSPVLLNAGEMQWIADELFVGNKLTAGRITTSDGTRVDLRNIRSPIVVFCSHGDDITPPQQALGWVLDLYGSEEELIANGQTIVYALHQSIGHLGIFVSGKVATKEHEEFAQCMDMIDLMPPGLYEAVITENGGDLANTQLISGNYLMSLEARTLEDIRALGTNPPEDDARFAAAARVSEINQGLYSTLLRPVVKALANETTAEWSRRTHPNRLRFEAFADSNPLMAPVATLAAAVRENRMPAAPDNPFLAWQNAMADLTVSGLKAWGEARDAMTEAFFLNVYGSPVVQAMVGLGADNAEQDRHAARDLAREAAIARMRDALLHKIDEGGLLEACVRALVHIRRPERKVDERGFAMLKAISALVPADKRIGFAGFKDMLREQSLILMLEEERAVAAIPGMLPADRGVRAKGVAVIRQLLSARGALPAESQARMDRIAAMFLPEPDAVAIPAEPVAAKPSSAKAARPAPVSVKMTAPRAVAAKRTPVHAARKRPAGAATGKSKRP